MRVAVTLCHLLTHADSIMVHAHHCNLTQETQQDHAADDGDIV